jgi:hypothetical protein
MRTSSFLSDHLRQFLRLKRIATLPELKQALGTTVDTTVFRKLKELSYRSSYSHRGRYYTLAEIPQFDSEGLWSFQTVWFSRWGNLVTTMEALVNGAPQGYFANELQQVLHVEVKMHYCSRMHRQRLCLGGQWRHGNEFPGGCVSFMRVTRARLRRAVASSGSRATFVLYSRSAALKL